MRTKSEEKENNKKEEQHQQCTYLFGAIQPTQIDALLLCDVAQPNPLLRFVQVFKGYMNTW